MNATDYINRFVLTDFLGMGGGGALYKKWIYTSDQYIRIVLPKHVPSSTSLISFPVAYSNILVSSLINTETETEVYLPSYKVYAKFVEDIEFLHNPDCDRRGPQVKSKITFLKRFWIENSRMADCHTVTVNNNVYIGGRSFLYDITNEQLLYYFTGDYVFNGEIFTCSSYTLHVNNYVFRNADAIVHKLLCKDALPKWFADGQINVRKYDIHNFGHLYTYPLTVKIHAPEEMTPPMNYTSLKRSNEVIMNDAKEFLHNIADFVNISMYPPGVVLKM